jgi:hypothetical protein
MTPVSAPNRGDFRGVARRREPVVNGGPDAASLDGRSPVAMVPRDQQQHSIAPCDCFFERSVDRPPGAVEGHPVKVEDPVGLDGATTQPLVPSGIEGCTA